MKKRIVGLSLSVLLFALSSLAEAAEKFHTVYLSPAPGASSVIWVAKEARLFDKHGLDVAPVLIPSSVRTLQAILAGESAIGESAGPAFAGARLAGGDIVAIAGSVNILTYYFVTVPGLKRPEDLRGKIGANQSPGTIADFALRLISLRIPFPQRGIYTTGKFIKEQPETVRRYVKAYVEAIHYFKTRKEETIQIIRRYSRVEDRKVLEHTWSWFTQNMPDAPYPPVEGYQTVLQEMALTNPKVAAVNAKDLVDVRFVKELEDSGFIAGLYKK